MPLTPGLRIGAYEVLAPIGAGGMGEVYRARDARLNRDVALKVLPESFALDPTRVSRFSREAQVLASLNHPNIGAIYGVEDSGGAQVLVLELVEGPTLADLLASHSGRPIDEVLHIGRQIAEALEAAHEVGIVHRDLKPANIKVRRDGTVKVLDFGLAKALDVTMSSDDVSQSPTMMPPDWTEVGTIVGTAAYMSPEQAAGKARRQAHRHLVVRRGADGDADRPAGVHRRDLLARARRGSARAARLHDASGRHAGAIAKAPAPVSGEGSETTPRLGGRRAPRVRRGRDPAGWPRDGSDGPDPHCGPARGRGGTGWCSRGKRGVDAAPLRARAPQGTTKFTLTPPPIVHSSSRCSRRRGISPSLVTGRSSCTRTTGGQLAIRRLDQLETTTIAGVQDAAMPFVSPDNQWIGFVQDNLSLSKVPVSGGAAITLARLPVWPRGASWLDENTIIIGTNSETSGLLRVPAGGGEPAVLTTPDRARGEEGHVLPFGLPGGRAVLFTIGAADPKDAQIAVLDLETGRRTTVLRGGRDAQYLASGHLVYESGLGMSAVRFDPRQQRVIGDPVRMLENLAVTPTAALNVAATSTGTLVYVMAAAGPAPKRSLVWIDRQGRQAPVGAPQRAYESARLSPDGANVVVGIRDQQNDLWMWSLSRQTLTRLTLDADIDLNPMWTRDARRVIFSSARAGVYNLYALDINRAGSEVRLTRSANTQLPNSVTADGAFVILHEVRPGSGSDIDRFPLQPGQATAPASGERLVHGPSDEWNGEVSPDGSLLAFQSGESDQAEVYVCPYPDVARARWQLSSGGGQEPAWTRGGRELVYVDGSGRLMVVSIERSGGEVHAVSRTTIATRGYANPVPWRSYDVSADGQRFLVIRQDDDGKDAAPIQFTVVQNWVDELRRLLPPS